MDFEEMRALERQLDQLGQSKDPEVQTYFLEAKADQKKNDYAAMKEKIDKAMELFRPSIPLAKILVERKVVANMTQARRMCDMGEVSVDGHRVYKHDKKISVFKEIKAGSKTIKGE